MRLNGLEKGVFNFEIEITEMKCIYNLSEIEGINQRRVISCKTVDGGKV